MADLARSLPSVLRSISSHFNQAEVRLFIERIVDQLLDVHLNMQTAGRRVLQHHKKHVLGAIDHEIGPGSAVPFELAGRARWRRHGIARIGTDAEAIAESKTVAWVVEVVARDARAPPI